MSLPVLNSPAAKIESYADAIAFLQLRLLAMPIVNWSVICTLLSFKHYVVS